MKYLPNGDFEREFLASEEAVAVVLPVAEAIADVAADRVRKRTEALADSIEAIAGVEDGVATGRVNANDFKAHWWEYGTSRHPADPYLRPAAEAITGNPVR